ncbi:MAG: nucleotidyltransferase domain-containing protein [Candidatus Margulisiibacteriota bacterium]
MRKIKLINEPGALKPDELRPAFGRLCEEKKIELLYLFGGAARGSSGRLSDIDLAYYSRQEAELLDLQNSLADLLKRDDIDLVNLKSANPLISYQVIKNGKLLFCSNEALKVQLEYMIVNKYLNTIHLRNEFHKSFTKAVQGGDFYGKT